MNHGRSTTVQNHGKMTAKPLCWNVLAFQAFICWTMGKPGSAGSLFFPFPSFAFPFSWIRRRAEHCKNHGKVTAKPTFPELFFYQNQSFSSSHVCWTGKPCCQIPFSPILSFESFALILHKLSEKRQNLGFRIFPFPTVAPPLELYHLQNSFDNQGLKTLKTFLWKLKKPFCENSKNQHCCQIPLFLPRWTSCIAFGSSLSFFTNYF